MTTLSCTEIRERIVDGDEDETLLEHARTCAECQPILAALLEVDEDLAALPPIDAPEALVEKTLARVREDRGETQAPSLLAAAFAILTSAIGALVVAPVIAVRWLLGIRSDEPDRLTPSPRAPDETRSRRPFGFAPILAMSSLVVVVALMTFERFGSMVKTKTRGAEAVVNGLPMAANDREEETEGGDFWRSSDAPSAPSAGEPAALVPSDGLFGGRDGRYRDEDQRDTTVLDESGLNETDVPAFELALRGQSQAQAHLGQGVETARPMGWTGESVDGIEDGYDDGVAHDRGEGDRRDDLHASAERITRGPEGANLETDQQALGPIVSQTAPAQELTPEEPLRTLADGDLGGDDLEATTATTVTTRLAIAPTAWDLAQVTSGLHFASSESWWANTYVPGDAHLRVLHTRLAASPALLAGSTRSALALAELATPTTPAVAAPTDRALSIGVHADTTAIEGPTRVRVEIALRAIDQAAGRRGALRVALVVDARNGLGADETAHLRALLGALSHSLTPRDRVILTAAGPAGGTLVPLGVLRHGQVEVALRHLADATSITGEAIPTSLEEALAAGLEAVAVDDDGAGLTLLVTPNGAHDAAVDQALHLGAVAGVPTTAVGIASAATTSSLDAIALAGEGRRRLVLSDDDATRAVREELTAASRLVARALRVRIRLAEGVQLVDVVGSRSLDADETRRTRESERAIDQSLARRLGIGQDRDDDDSGVRILVPSFYAGDSHTIVLDVLVTRPGPVADVDVRFKDLVRLGNGTASSALALEAGTEPRGPRELRVVASYVGHEVAGALDEAASAMDRGDVAVARSRLMQTRTLIDQARAAVDGLASVPSIAADARLLDAFLAATASATDPSLVASSLHYAAARRIVIPQLQATAP